MPEFQVDYFATVPRRAMNGWRQHNRFARQRLRCGGRFIDVILFDELRREGYFGRIVA